MPKSKRTQESKQRLQKFKNNNKTSMENQMNMQMGQAPNELPAVREVPTWQGNDKIEVMGIEFETMYNGVNEMGMIMQRVFGAAQSIMQRNLLNGTIKVRFEKLVDKTSPDGTAYQDYEMMTPEEEAPHQENFAKMVEGILEARQKASQPLPEAPRLDAIVSESGLPVGENPAIVDALGQPISSN